MVIFINHKKDKFENHFPKVENFIDFLKKEYPSYFNFNNEDFFKRLSELYQKLCTDEGLLSCQNLHFTLTRLLGCKNLRSLHDKLTTCGFDEAYIRQIKNRKEVEHNNEQKELVKKLLKENDCNTFKYHKFTFKYNGEPKCNLCGSKLEFKPYKGEWLKIYKCTNPDCPTNNKRLSDSEKHKAFFPKDFYEETEKERKKGFIFRPEYWINKGYTEEEAKVKAREVSLEMGEKAKKVAKDPPKIDKGFVEKRLGKEASKIFFRERSQLCIEYWLKRGYTEEYGHERIKEIQSKNTKKRKTFCSWTSVEYWIKKGYTEEDAKKIISERQCTFSLEKCIEKYGEEKGRQRWLERQEKWLESKKKSDVIGYNYSRVSQELFSTLMKYYGDRDISKVFYATKNKERYIRDGDTNYAYDFMDVNLKKIIEFNGDIFHGNPCIFEETDSPNPYRKDLTSKDIWDMDEKKNNVARNHGYDVFVVWEKEYMKNKEETVNKCLKFLFENE